MLRRLYRKLFRPKGISKPPEFKTEEEHYEYLFTKDPAWSTSTMNLDEALRWGAIKSYMDFCAGIEKEKEQNKKSLEILDLGCGRGWLSNQLSSFGKVMGIEPVKKVVEFGKRLFPRLNLNAGRAEDLLAQGYNERFDVIVSSEVIEHVPEDQKNDFVEKSSRLVKKDGYVIITTPRKEAWDEWSTYLPPNQPIEAWMSEDEIRKIFSENGFTEIRKDQLLEKPAENAPAIPVYQTWLFRKTKSD
ncbi:MAG: class I SAM-dependent methyltransferase [Flavisolibacter sp.]